MGGASNTGGVVLSQHLKPALEEHHMFTVSFRLGLRTLFETAFLQESSSPTRQSEGSSKPNRPTDLQIAEDRARHGVGVPFTSLEPNYRPFWRQALKHLSAEIDAEADSGTPCPQKLLVLRRKKVSHALTQVKRRIRSFGHHMSAISALS